MPLYFLGNLVSTLIHEFSAARRTVQRRAKPGHGLQNKTEISVDAKVHKTGDTFILRKLPWTEVTCNTNKNLIVLTQQVVLKVSDEAVI